MIRIALETLVMGNIPGASIVILRPVEQEPTHDRVLPICIGPVEAAAIGKAISGDASSRPMTHSLLGTTIATLGGRLESVSISKVTGTIFYATLDVRQGDQLLHIDARPSDAVALALRMRAPMYVAESVIEVASFPAWVNGKSDQEKVELEQFHDFVEQLEPEDFLTETLHSKDSTHE